MEANLRIIKKKTKYFGLFFCFYLLFLSSLFPFSFCQHGPPVILRRLCVLRFFVMKGPAPARHSPLVDNVVRLHFFLVKQDIGDFQTVRQLQHRHLLANQSLYLIETLFL